MKYNFPVSRAIGRKIGRRGAFLAFLTTLDILYGWSLYATPLAQRASVDLLLPYSAWAWIWVGAGLVISTGILARKDVFQFTVAALLKVSWALTWLDIWIFGTMPRAWIASVIWISFAAIVLVIAGWQEPVEIQKPREPRVRLLWTRFF